MKNGDDNEDMDGDENDSGQEFDEKPNDNETHV